MTVADGKVSNVVIGGKQLRLDATYRFTVPSFNAAGGDGYPKLLTTQAMSTLALWMPKY